jgi:hypothetical protein
LPLLFGVAHLIDGVVDDLDSVELVEGVGQTPGDAFEEAGLMSVQTSSIASGSPRGEIVGERGDGVGIAASVANSTRG